MVKKQKSPSSNTEFLVVLEGFTLPPDTEDRIAAEIRKAVLAELATVDLRPGEVTFGAIQEEGGGGPTQGIHAVFRKP